MAPRAPRREVTTVGPVLLVMIAGTLGFLLGALSRRATSADGLLVGALRSLDTAESDVAHWRRLARYWQCRAEHSEDRAHQGTARRTTPIA